MKNKIIFSEPLSLEAAMEFLEDGTGFHRWHLFEMPIQEQVAEVYDIRPYMKAKAVFNGVSMTMDSNNRVHSGVFGMWMKRSRGL